MEREQINASMAKPNYYQIARQVVQAVETTRNTKRTRKIVARREEVREVKKVKSGPHLPPHRRRPLKTS